MCTYLLLIIHSYLCITVINQPDDVTVCEGRSTTFTCVLDVTDIKYYSAVQWYRLIKDNGTTVMVDPQDRNVCLPLILLLTIQH